MRILRLTIVIVVLLALAGTVLYLTAAQGGRQQPAQPSLAEEEPSVWDREPSAYQKLADGRDISMLIVGDSIGGGAGASDADHRWGNLLKAALAEKYHGAVEVTNVSMGGNTSYAGYVRLMALDDGVDYDLILLCYGQNDDEADLGLYYEALVRAAKGRYPRASVLVMLESSQRDYTEKIRTIQTIAEHYGLPIADTIAPFQQDYASLVNDSVHPNDLGYQVYCDTVLAVIDDSVAAGRGLDPRRVAVMDDRVTAFDTFRWLDVEKFTREGNTFIRRISAHAAILGIDYNFTSGQNTCQILVDGVEYAAPEVTFNYDFSQRHIMIVNGWPEGDAVDARSEIRVAFGDDEAGEKQANGFKGLALSGL